MVRIRQANDLSLSQKKINEKEKEKRYCKPQFHNFSYNNYISFTLNIRNRNNKKN